MQEKAIIERKPVWYGYWVILLCLILVGLGFLGYRYSAGLSTTNMGSMVSWGIWISLYILFIGLSAGSFLLSTLIYVFNVKRYERIGKLALYLAMVCLVTALLFVLADLGHPERFWKVFTTTAFSSVLWWEILFYIIYFAVIAVELYYLYRADRIKADETSRKKDMKVVKTMGLIGIPTAIAVHGGTGAVFAVIKAVPHWNTPLLPIIFITSALVSGAALLLFLRAFFVRPAQDEKQFLSGLGKLTIGLLAVDWVLVIFEFLVILYGAIPDAAAAMMDILFGASWWAFWIVQVGIGVIIPVYLILLAPKSRVSLGVAGLAVVFGIVAVRWNIIVPGLMIPKLPGFSESFFSPRLTTIYFPSVVEWLSSMGLLALFMAMVTLGIKFLPLQTTLEGSSDIEGGH